MRKLTPNIKKIAANTGWLFADRILRMGVGVVVWVWIARYLGPNDFGLLNYAIAFVTLLSPIATLGLDNLIVKELVEDQENKNLSLGTAFVMRLTGGALALIVSLVLIFFVRPGDALMHWMVGIVAFTSIIQAFDVIDFWFQSLVRSKYTVVARNAAFIAASGIRVYLILAKAPVISFIWVNLIEALLAAAGMIFFYHYNRNNILQWKVSREKVRALLKNTMLVTLSSSAVFVYLKIDILLLGELKGDASAGIYSAAVKISEVFYFVANVLVTSVYPVILGDPEIYNIRLKKLFDLLVWVSYLIILPIAFLAPLIISVFGSKYSASASVLSIHIWATVFVFFTYAQNSWYIKNGTKGLVLQLKRTAAGAALNIVLNFILIPYYDVTGAAVATVISYAYVAYFSNMFSKESFEVFKMQSRSLLLLNLFGSRKAG